MLKCKVCGTKFNAIIERHYLARDNGKTGLAVAFVLLLRRDCMMPLTAQCVVAR